jgi:hypothetical protein
LVQQRRKNQKSQLYTHFDEESADEGQTLTTQTLIETLSKLDFWCGDDHKHETNPDYSKDYCCLTHVVGLPRHPATQKEMALTPYQVDFFNQVMKAVSNPGEMSDEDWERYHHAFHVLKGRQMGFTEIVLRVIQFFCFNRYAGQNVGIIAATNGELANKDLRRFYRLFKNIKDVTTGPVKARKLKIINDTIIEAFPASEEALTGDTNYACIFMDESAKWKLVDDTPVFNSVMPIVRMNGSDFFLVSTPKGPLKMFYKIYKDPQEFVMLEYDIWKAEDNIYTHDQIVEMLKTTKEDPNQEYLCKFTIGKDSILGAITDEDRDDNVTEWNEEEINEEDDSYVEPDDDVKRNFDQE